MANQPQPKFSTIVANTSRDDRGDIRRCSDSSVHPEMGVHGCRTMYEGLRHGKLMNPIGPCLGYRAISNNGLATPFIYFSYSEVVARVDCFAAGLDRLDLVPPNDDGLRLLGLYLPNCCEWIIAEHGVYSVGGSTVPFYDTCK